MSTSKEALDNLRKIYFDVYGTEISDAEALNLSIKLIELFKVIAKQIPGNKAST